MVHLGGAHSRFTDVSVEHWSRIAQNAPGVYLMRT